MSPQERKSVKNSKRACAPNSERIHVPEVGARGRVTRRVQVPEVQQSAVVSEQVDVEPLHQQKPSVNQSRRVARNSASFEKNERAERTRPSAPKQPSPKTKVKIPRQTKRWPWIVASGALVVLVAFFGWYTWEHFYHYDDKADFQGAWSVAATGANINITDKKIQLAIDADYAYTLDTDAKTLDFSFTTLKGTGRYRFSYDRQTLVVVEGVQANVLSTYFNDIGYTVAGAFATLTGGQLPAADDGFVASNDVVVTVFTRTQAA